MIKSTSKIEWELAHSDFSYLYVTITPDNLKLLQEKLISILSDFHQFSLDENIEYAIVAGTLIGAIRHKGFIPWDDDIDLILPRCDYERLKDIFLNSSLSTKYELIFPETDTDISLCAKLAIKGESLYTLFGNEFSEDDKIYIDLLPVDFVPENRILQKLIGYSVNILSISYASLRCWKRYTPYLYVIAKKSKELKENLFFRKILSLPAMFLGRKLMIKLITLLLSTTRPTEKATVALGVKRYFGEVINYVDFFPSKEIKFDSLIVKSPNNADKYLRNRYGDYMVIPDKNEQSERLIRLRSNWEELLK